MSETDRQTKRRRKRRGKEGGGERQGEEEEEEKTKKIGRKENWRKGKKIGKTPVLTDQCVKKKTVLQGSASSSLPPDGTCTNSLQCATLILTKSLPMTFLTLTGPDLTFCRDLGVSVCDPNPNQILT